MFKEITAYFKEDELLWDYDLLISNYIKENYSEDPVIYSFPQITKWWVHLKNRVAKKLIELNLKRQFNVWFVVDNTSNVLFKVFLF